MSDENQVQQEQQVEQPRLGITQQLEQELLKATEAEKLNNPGAVEQQKTPAHEMSDMERQARAMGWKSQEEREAEGKGVDNFVDADEYVRRGPLLRRIEDQSKQLRELRNIQKQAQDNLISIRKEAYERARRDLEVQQLQSVETGNTQQFNQTKMQIQNLHQQMQNDPIMNAPQIHIEPEKDPDVAQFEQKHSSWYMNETTNENKEMMAAAQAADSFLYRRAKIRQGLDLNDQTQVPELNKKEHLAAIEAQVKELFPHRFEAKKPPVVSVGKSTSNSNEGISTTSLVHRLTAGQLEIGKDMVRQTPGYSLEKYANDLSLMGRLK